MKLYETRSLYVEQPWPGAGLRIMDKLHHWPYGQTGAFYNDMGAPYHPDALVAASACANAIQAEIDGRV